MASENVSIIRIKLNDKSGKKAEAQIDFQNASFGSAVRVRKSIRKI